MPAPAVVQSGSTSALIPSSGPHTVSVNLVFASPVTAGNTIIVCYGSRADGLGTVGSPSATDTLGNTYSLVTHVNAGTQIQGLAFLAARNVLGGMNTLSFSATASFTVGGTAAFAVAYAEVSGLTGAIVQGSAIQQNGPAGGVMNLTVTDSVSTAVTSHFDSPALMNQQSGAVMDISGGGNDFFVACMSGSYSSATVFGPTVTSPAAYLTYNLLENPIASNGAYYLAFWTPTSILSISCGSPPGAILGSPYSHLFPTSGGTDPLTFAITSGALPDGLVLNISTGSVSGIPTTVGVFSFTIQVTDSLGAIASRACSISVAAGGAWIIQEINAELIPCDPEIPGFGHFRYTVRCIDAAQAGTYLGFWDSFGGGSGGTGGGGSASGTSLPPAPPGQPPGGSTVLAVAHNGTLVGSEPKVNIIDSATAVATVTDDTANSKIDVTINSKVEVGLSGSLIGTEPEINFIPGSNIGIGVVDNPGSSRVDVTISSTAPATYTSLTKYTASWSSQTSVTVTHGLGTTAVLVQVYDAGGAQVEPQAITVTSTNVVTLTFGVSFTGSVVILASSTRSLSSVYTTSWSAQTSVTVTHNLGSLNVVVQVFDSGGVQAQPQNVAITSANVVTLTFGAAFSGSVIVVAQPPRIVQSYSTSWTSQTSVTATHNLGTADVIVEVFDSGGNEVAPQAITVIDANNVQVDFAVSFSGSLTVLG